MACSVDNSLLEALCLIIVDVRGAGNSINRHAGNLILGLSQKWKPYLNCQVFLRQEKEDSTSLLYVPLYYVFYWDIYKKKNVVNSDCSKTIALEWHGGDPSFLPFMGKRRHLVIKCLLGNLSLGLQDIVFPGSPSTSLVIGSIFSWPLPRCPKSRCPPELCPWPSTICLPHKFSCLQLSHFKNYLTLKY